MTAQTAWPRTRLWWWPTDPDREALYASQTLRVIRNVARVNRGKQHAAGVASGEMVLEDDDLESYLQLRAFEFRARCDAATWCVNLPILDQWCRVLYTVLAMEAKNHISKVYRIGVSEWEKQWILSTQSSIYQPLTNSQGEETGATVGDRGRWLWDSGEPTEPEDHLIAVERLRRKARLAVVLDGPMTPDRFRLYDRITAMDWDQLLTLLDHLTGGPKPGQCAEFGCMRPPRSGRAGALCQHHHGKHTAETAERRAATGEQQCAEDGCTRPVIARSRCTTHYQQLQRQGPLPPIQTAKDRTCTEPGCDRPQHSKGLCNPHYQRRRYQQKRAADPNYRPHMPAAGRTCSQPDCDRPAQARGLCLKHYKRARKAGTL